jgi:LysR family transcriptional regulator, benzoate and cis,cis-muconate-responsive activator of ben and cat genes
VELRQIDCFLAVATQLNFWKAAERLSIAQSSISEAVRFLEHEVGGQLFVGTSRRVQLTPLGAKLRLGIERTRTRIEPGRHETREAWRTLPWYQVYRD